MSIRLLATGYEMKVRKSIKVFAVISIALMLLLALFLAWDFDPLYYGRGGMSFDIGDIRDSMKEFLDFEGRRVARHWKALETYAAKLDQFAKANPDDVQALTGLVELYEYRDDVDGVASTIRSTWPQYKPAMAVQAWRELRASWRVASDIRDFTLRIERADPNDDLILYPYDMERFMLKPDDPFTRPAEGSEDVGRVYVINTDPVTGNKVVADCMIVTDPAAAKKAVTERLTAKADESITRLRDLGPQDPNNALYDYLLAIGSARLGRRDEAAASLRAASGKTLNLYRTERLTCLKKFMEKMGFSKSLQQFTIDESFQALVDRQPSTMANLLRRQAAEAEKQGDIEGANAARDAAQRIIDDTAAQKPPAQSADN